MTVPEIMGGIGLFVLVLLFFEVSAMHASQRRIEKTLDVINDSVYRSRFDATDD